MDIFFATGNKGKIASMTRELSPYGITVKSADLNMLEPQLDSIVEIAQFKAKEAFNKLGKPVVVQDTGFSIKALNGFPGPYSKYAQETLGADGFMRLMDGQEDRECHFHGVIVYIDENGEMHTFEEKGPHGVISDTVDQNPLKDMAWSCLWQIYIPKGATKTLNAMTDQEYFDWMAHGRGVSNFKRFAQFIVDKYGTKPQNTIAKSALKKAP